MKYPAAQDNVIFFRKPVIRDISLEEVHAGTAFFRKDTSLLQAVLRNINS